MPSCQISCLPASLSSHVCPGASHAGKRYDEAIQQLKAAFEECQQAPEAFAFLCDEVTHSIAHSAVSGRLLHDLSDMHRERFEETYIVGCHQGTNLPTPANRAVVGGAAIEVTPWWNLDGREAELALDLLGPLASELAPGPMQSRLVVSLFATIRLVAGLELATNRGLDGIDATLGCPVSLFPQVSAHCLLPGRV